MKSSLINLKKEKDLFSFPSFFEKTGCFWQKNALRWMVPIDRSVAISIRAFCTAILPGKFGNQGSYQTEILRRIAEVTFCVICLPLALTSYAIGIGCEMIGSLFYQRPYSYLKGQVSEKSNSTSFDVFSANICMLAYGISYFAGLRHPSERIEKTAQAIIKADPDFIFLQELASSYAFSLWDKISDRYAHGFTRIGPMPWSRMEASLFFASKYPIEQVRYEPLTYQGAIVRGAFCVKTEAGWMIGAHLSQGKENVDLRKTQMQEIADLCDKISLGGEIPCAVFIDSNILQLGTDDDEYSNCKPIENFVENRADQKPTCTNLLTYSIQGKEDPICIHEAFEWIDHAFVYKPSQEHISLETSLVPGYDLEDRENALSDHQILYSKIKLHNKV